ncbi:MAG TPA: ABC transporter permease [Anaeromyxobacter sp.]|nr:ABC transporter permease [Anaeromyxobacter sp.]
MSLWLASFRQGLREEWALLLGGRSRRERSGILTVLLAIPLLYPAVVTYLYHGEEARERPALLLDLDQSALSRRLALDLEATPELRIVGRPAGLEEGQAALRRGEAELMVVVPADLSRKVKQGERAQLAVWGAGGNVYTWSIALPAVSAAVATVDAELAARSLLAAGLPPEVARRRASPIATGDRRLFHPSGSYGRYLAVGVLLIVIQQLVVVSLAFSAGVRRERGLPVGAPPSPVGHLSGMAAAHAPFWLGGLLFVSAVLLPWMGWAGPSVAATAAIFAALAAALVPVAIAVASLVPDRMTAFQVLMFFSVPLFVASGFTWPAGQLPGAVRVATAVFPATPALQALRILSMKSGDLRTVAPELLWLVGQFLGYAALAWLVVLRPWRRPRRGAADPVTSGSNP